MAANYPNSSRVGGEQVPMGDEGALFARSAILLDVLFKSLQGDSEQMYRKCLFNKILF